MAVKKNEFIADIDTDFAQWYTDIVIKAQLIDYTEIKGCLAIRPYGYAIWELIQKELDTRFKETGHENVYMPLLIPESLLQIEKDHVKGFAPEVAWVTHGGSDLLEERMCIRPTSETLFCSMYSKWVKSWRDLPMLYNQWCSVMRWEKTTRPFLRSREFLWQEGHTIHLTEEEAHQESLMILDIYANFCEKILAIPVLKGKKTDKEKFPGAKATYSLETLMHDSLALQIATTHDFSQNFTKPFKIEYTSDKGVLENPYQTSWGISTRTIGGLIMVHGDNNGLVMPPNIAPIQIVIVPIAQQKEKVLEKARELYEQLKAQGLRVKLDDRDQFSTGYKFSDWEMKGVPIRIEIGPKDIENNKVVVARRDNGEKIDIQNENIIIEVKRILEESQQFLFNKALKHKESRTEKATTMEQFTEIIKNQKGYIKAMWCGETACEDKVKETTEATARCIPFEQEKVSDVCVCCGKPAKTLIYWAKAY